MILHILEDFGHEAVHNPHAVAVSRMALLPERRRLRHCTPVTRKSFGRAERARQSDRLICIFAGLPRNLRMVIGTRFLRNPFYDPILALSTGMDRSVAEHVGADGLHLPFLDRLHDLLRLLLPRFVTKGRKYVTSAVGCSGGLHQGAILAESGEMAW